MRLDPRTKLLILAVTSVSVFMNKSIAVECVLAGIPLVLLSVSGNLKRMLKYAAFFLALLLIQLFIVPRLPVTFGGIVYMFAVYIRKLLPCFMLGSFLIATTSVSKFLAAITKLRLSKGLTIALAVSGGIGFVGLVAPHMARRLIGGRHHALMPASMLLGALLLLLADTLGRSAFQPREIPVGIVISVLSAPYFLFLLRRYF